MRQGENTPFLWYNFGMNNNPENFIGSSEFLSKQEIIRKQFSEPFTKEEIANGWDEIKNHTPSNVAYPKKLINREFEGCNYSVDCLSFYDFRSIQFRLLNESSKNVAELIFEEHRDHVGVWKLTHRTVNTNELGISGTEFLQKAEEYIKLVANNRSIIAEKFSADASQEKVINWLLKNGYEFSSAEDSKMYDHYLNNPDEYQFFKVTDGSGEELLDRELVIFKTDEVDWTELDKFRNEDNSELLDGNMSLLKVKGLLRIHLKKDIISEVEQLS